MEQQNKNFKLVANKKTRSILPNMFTLVGVCIGLTSIKFALMKAGKVAEKYMTAQVENLEDRKSVV